MTREEAVAALNLAAQCMEDEQEPSSHIGQYMWRGGAMNSNIGRSKITVLIDEPLAGHAYHLMSVAVQEVVSL